ncbi:oxidoreductase tpcG [Aspergillus brunneoviolaceus CBS 621.78]|uniref:NAD-dependent epimerase/dehydratase n=1 Tax=Aspergillus brunneoviolaceus CBS 621.78 TaxID=1450534 RepID=A0ACD1FWC9_9EURO|nr:putative NAD-dependent epimerase/dehydratase [Aspergillus brunneoviolaceus CBS 621.78]RAH41252.1 putative NAD-dependent epimerase/dehydratase [Aspergillus brunneoviolaceus CBS 621.78]
MSTYAILGATGNCGTALIDNLLRTENARIHAYCRNKAKLTQKVPAAADSKRITVFEGNIYDIDLLAECIRDTRAIFHVVTTNDNVPGCHVGLDTAKSIIAAIEKLKLHGQLRAPLPKIVLLSSGTIDDHLSRHMPWWFRPILRTAASHVYEDLRRTEAYLRAQEDLVSTIFIKPGGLAVDAQRGHELNLDHDESFVSYLDLAAGMIEAADDEGGRYQMKNVSVVNRNGSAKFPSGTPMCIATGLARHFFPFLHAYLPSTGPS